MHSGRSLAKRDSNRTVGAIGRLLTPRDHPDHAAKDRLNGYEQSVPGAFRPNSHFFTERIHFAISKIRRKDSQPVECGAQRSGAQAQSTIKESPKGRLCDLPYWAPADENDGH